MSGTAEPVPGNRWARLGYLTLVGVVTSFLVGLAVVAVVEAVGPSSRQDGTVISREEGEQRVTTCGLGGGCRTTTYPVFSVTGERADGTTWIVVGEGPYDAMRGERGRVVGVITSTVTGRVVGLDGDDDWHAGGSGLLWLSIGGLVIWLPCLAAYEVARRRGRFRSVTRFVGWEPLLLVPAILAGLAGLWFATLSRTAGLDVPSLQDRFGRFVADPFQVFVVDAPTAAEGDRAAVGAMAGETGNSVTVLDPRSLVEDVRQELGDGGEVLAIPLVHDHTGPGAASTVELTLTAAGGDVNPVGCPSTLPAYPTEIGTVRDLDGGFVCFPREADGGELVAVLRRGSVGHVTVRLDYVPTFA